MCHLGPYPSPFMSPRGASEEGQKRERQTLSPAIEPKPSFVCLNQQMSFTLNLTYMECCALSEFLNQLLIKGRRAIID